MQQRLLDLIAFKSLIKKSTICINKTSKALKISRVSFGEKMVTRLLHLWAWRNSVRCKFDLKKTKQSTANVFKPQCILCRRCFSLTNMGITAVKIAFSFYFTEFQQVRLYWQPVFDKGLKQTTQIKQSNLNYRTIGFTAIFYIQWMVLSHFHDVATPAADNVALKEWPVLV